MVNVPVPYTLAGAEPEMVPNRAEAKMAAVADPPRERRVSWQGPYSFPVRAYFSCIELAGPAWSPVLMSMHSLRNLDSVVNRLLFLWNIADLLRKEEICSAFIVVMIYQTGGRSLQRRICRALQEPVPDFERLVTDESHIRAYPYATDAHCGNQDMRRTVENAFPGLKQ